MARQEQQNYDYCKELERERMTKSGVPREAIPRMKNLAQAEKHQIPKVKADLKTMLPLLNPVEIRRFQILHYEAVILELKEEGFGEASDFLRILIELDEKMRKQTQSGTKITIEPYLKNKKEFINFLRDSLRLASLARQECNPLKEASAILDVALYFQLKSWEWWWISNKFFKIGLKIADEICDDDSQMISIIRYFYGKFLLNELENPQEALNFLRPAYEKSKDKAWKIRFEISEVDKNNLFVECCILISQAYLKLSEKVKEKDASLALRACEQAYKRACESEQKEQIAMTLFQMGQNELTTNDTTESLKHFSKYLAIAKRIPDFEGVCDAHAYLALTYKKLEIHENVMKHLRLFQESATEYQLPHRLAQAHYQIGEYLLNKDQPEDASPHLSLAFDLYQNLNLRKEAELSRCMAAVSKGQEIMGEYIKMIVKCSDNNSEELKKLYDWKINRVPFWTVKKQDSGEIEWFELEKVEDSYEGITSDWSFPSLQDDGDENLLRNDNFTDAESN